MGVLPVIEDSKANRMRALDEFARAEYLRRRTAETTKFWVGAALISLALFFGALFFR
jgi:hypothetical protein